VALGFERRPSTRFGGIYFSRQLFSFWFLIEKLGVLENYVGKEGRDPEDTAYDMSRVTEVFPQVIYGSCDSCCPNQNKNVPLLSWSGSEQIGVNKISPKYSKLMGT